MTEYAPLNWRREIPKREQRAFQVRHDYREKNNDWAWFLVAVIMFGSAALFFLTTVFHLTDVAKAEDTMTYRDVHTIEQACTFARANPGMIVNAKSLPC